MDEFLTKSFDSEHSGTNKIPINCGWLQGKNNVRGQKHVTKIGNIYYECFIHRKGKKFWTFRCRSYRNGCKWTMRMKPISIDVNSPGQRWKYIFWKKIEILGFLIKILVKIETWSKIICQKIEIFLKIEIFVKNPNISQKIEIFLKIEIFVKNQNNFQKIAIVAKSKLVFRNSPKNFSKNRNLCFETCQIFLSKIEICVWKIDKNFNFWPKLIIQIFSSPPEFWLRENWIIIPDEREYHTCFGVTSHELSATQYLNFIREKVSQGITNLATIRTLSKIDEKYGQEASELIKSKKVYRMAIYDSNRNRTKATDPKNWTNSKYLIYIL